MAVKTAQALLERMASDGDFRTRVESAPDADAKKAILDAAGYGEVTPDEVQAAGANFTHELSDAELEAVAGGSTLEWVGAGVLVVGAAGAAAA